MRSAPRSASLALEASRMSKGPRPQRKRDKGFGRVCYAAHDNNGLVVRGCDRVSAELLRSLNNVFCQFASGSVSVHMIEHRPVECSSFPIDSLGDSVCNNHKRISRFQRDRSLLKGRPGAQAKHSSSALECYRSVLVSPQQNCTIVARIYVVHFSSENIDARAKHRREEV